MNKIYELVFYWEDIYNGCEITETILTTMRIKTTMLKHL